MTLGGGDVGLHAPVEELALLALSGRQIVEDFGAWEVIELVFSDIGVDGQQGMGTECVLVAGCNIPGEDALALNLSIRLLIEVIGDFQLVPRQEQVQVEYVR